MNEILTQELQPDTTYEQPEEDKLRASYRITVKENLNKKLIHSKLNVMEELKYFPRLHSKIDSALSVALYHKNLHTTAYYALTRIHNSIIRAEEEITQPTSELIIVYDF